MNSLLFLLALASVTAHQPAEPNIPDPTSEVCPFMGSGYSGHLIPNAAVPHGMVQLAADTFDIINGYDYRHTTMMGFSHQHKSGSGGGSDWLDILFLPVRGSEWYGRDSLAYDYSTPFSHEREWAEPGYYSVELPEQGVKAELTATPRCGVHRYTFDPSDTQALLINLEHGNRNNCTIFEDECHDDVKEAYIEKVGRRRVRGYRISNGWCPEQHVYFYARFSRPIKGMDLYDNMKKVGPHRKLKGLDVRAILLFGGDPSKPLEVSVGISPVDMKGARKNLCAEARHSFDFLKDKAKNIWKEELSALDVAGSGEEHRKVLYTCFYNTLLYPVLYSDVDGRYRGADRQVHKADFRYFGGVLGLWDTFRAQFPLTTILDPDITKDALRTFQAHFDACGQLPIWVLSGQENMCMIGYHSMPVIADAYAKGVREGYDAEKLLDAMVASADRDTFGFFLHDYRGSVNYLKYGYCPCDKEISSVSKTLEYAYDDWCIAQMARMLGKKDIEERFLARSMNYRNVFDKESNSMRGRNADGSWRTPFDRFLSNHYRSNDDFCEGTAWQWSFFVPHDPEGLMELYGGSERFAAKLDSLFVVSSELHGEHVAGDITGLIGQYAHGNEPSHHTIYMYDFCGQPWKAQKLITTVVSDFYNTGIDGVCGDEDTGQMSAWYVFSSMGFYPVNHGTAEYCLGVPQQEYLTLLHSKGLLTVRAPGFSRENCYVQSVKLNGEPINRTVLTHTELFGGDATLEFEMGPAPKI